MYVLELLLDALHNHRSQRIWYVNWVQGLLTVTHAKGHFNVFVGCLDVTNQPDEVCVVFIVVVIFCILVCICGIKEKILLWLDLLIMINHGYCLLSCLKRIICSDLMLNYWYY